MKGKRCESFPFFFSLFFVRERECGGRMGGGGATMDQEGGGGHKRQRKSHTRAFETVESSFKRTVSRSFIGIFRRGFHPNDVQTQTGVFPLSSSSRLRIFSILFLGFCSLSLFAVHSKNAFDLRVLFSSFFF